MKKWIAALLSLSMLLALCACAPQEPDPPAEPQPQTPAEPGSGEPQKPEGNVPGDGNAQFEKDDGSFRLEERYENKDYKDGDKTLLRVELNYPYAEGRGEPAESMRSYYENWVERMLTFAESDLLPQAREMASGVPDSVFMGYAVGWSFDTLRCDDKVVSVLQQGYQQTGGAHPQLSLESQNFSAENGGLIALGDLFTVEEDAYLELIRGLVLPMMQQREKDGEAAYYPGYEGYMMQVFDQTDFCLMEDALRVFWQTDSISPHAAGIQRFDLTFDQLGDALAEEWK